MKHQPHRLPAETPRGFAGTLLDRSKPLRFRLDGRLISGFAGDTVLSAALAAGIDTLGLHAEDPIVLSPRSAPAISYASLAADPQRALSMARTPALDNAEFVTLGGRRTNPLTRLFQPGHSLGLTLDGKQSLGQPWRGVPGIDGGTSDLLVVGGGVAGMAAALAGARAGLSVTLLEAQPHLGGHSGLFGTQEGEDKPEESVARLSAEVAASDAITVFTGTHVFSIHPGTVRAHRIAIADGAAQGQVIDLSAPRIILATGSLERLPLFAGNRLPGVAGTLEAFELASRYGVWPGRDAIIATTSNFAYRLATLTSDAGIAIRRILDTRPHPASRFIEFSRAYGIVQSPGAIVRSVDRGRGSLAIAVADHDATLEASRLIVSGGWQPDLTLWHVAGGASQWHHAHHRLESLGTLDGIALAGSAAGHRTRRGCIQSGADSVDQLLGRPRRPVEDPVIDPLYETPDAPLPVAEIASDKAPAYLDGGINLMPRPLPPRRSLPLPFRRPRPQGFAALSTAPQPLTLGEVAAAVALGAIPTAAAGIVAQERVALVPLTTVGETSHAETPMEETAVPSYLAGRFGPDTMVVRLTPVELRRLEPGALIFAQSDFLAPAQAVGVVLRPAGDAAMALISSRTVAAGLAVSVRDGERTVPARLEPPST